MSKYNLSDLVKEYIGGGRIGTLKISYRDLVDKMDELEKLGNVVVRDRGPSADGKVNREFEVVLKNEAVPGGNRQEKGFTVYDYKFGFDPGDIDNFEEEYNFSVGGNNLALAQDLGLDVKPYRLEEEKSGNVIKDLAQADEVIKMIKMMNPDVRQDLLMRIARMGQKLNEGDLFSSKFSREDLKDIINDLNKGLILDIPTRRAYKFLTSLLDKQDRVELGLDEQMYIDDEEFNKEMGRSKKDALRQEMMFHVNQLMDGNIDKNDFMNVVEDIMMDLGLKEEIEIPGSVLNKIAASVSNPATGAKAMLDFYRQIQDKENIDLATNAKFKMAIDKLKDLADDKEVDEVMGIDRKGRKKPESKSNMTKVNEESNKKAKIRAYLKDYYTNPKDPKDVRIDDGLIDEFFEYSEDVPNFENMDMDEIVDEYDEFIFQNKDVMEDVRKHFKRFM